MNQERISENKKRFAIVISFLILMICITSSTYAYYALTASDSNNVVGSVGIDGGLEVNVTKLFPESTSRMIPQLESTLGAAISEEYSCIDGNGNVVCQVYEASVTNAANKVDLNGYIKFNFSSGSNMPNLKWKRIDNARSIGEYTSKKASVEDTLFVENDDFASTATKTYYFVIWIDEIGAAQYDTGTFSATIKFSTVSSGLTSTIDGSDNNITAAQHIIDLYNTGEETDYIKNVSYGTNGKTVDLNNVQSIMKVDQGSTYGEEYRYYGASPNNYVEFNGELWRIISSSNVKSNDTDTLGEQRLKLIKASSLGTYGWGENTTSDWSTSGLSIVLDTLYYGSTKDTCYVAYGTTGECNFEGSGLDNTARSLIDTALWNLGGSNIDSSLYADDYYTFERGISVYNGNANIWTGKVGLMYPSDYMYATDLNFCRNPGYYRNDNWEFVDYSVDECKNNNWLYSNGESKWTLTPASDSAYNVYVIYSPGHVAGLDYFDYMGDGTYTAVPVVYLKSNVIITDGEGTDGNPYQLALSE